MSVVKVKAFTTKMLSRARARIAERKLIQERENSKAKAKPDAARR